MAALLTLFLLGGAVAASAQFTFWSGGNGTTTWADSNNWSNGIPTLSDDTIIDTNTGPMPVLVGVPGATAGLTVGLFTGSNATLIVQDGAVLSSNTYGTIGSQAGANGAVTVSNATWTVASSLDVGSFGLGNFSVLAGANVTVGDELRLGADVVGQGALLVSGNGSVVTVTNSTIIGDGGTGNLTITNGGKVEVNDPTHTWYSVIAYDTGANSTVTVANGGQWLNHTTLYLGYQGGVGNLSVLAGGNVTAESVRVGFSGGVGNVSVSGNSAVLNGGMLRVGESSTGNLIVTNGGYGFTESASIGYGAKGTLSVDGTAAKWVNNTTIEIGGSGNGTLNILNGGNFTNGRATIGYIDAIGNADGSHGVVTITGENSTWNNLNDFLNIGGAGNGSLTILNGASANVTGVAIGSDTTGNGTVLISGNSAHANATLTVHSYLGVGEFGIGNLTVKDGGMLDTHDTFMVSLGSFSGAQGNVTISNATWNGGTTGTLLLVGDDGHGNLSIEQGGVVTVASASIASCDCGDGQAEVSGGNSTLNVVEGPLLIGELAQGNLSITSNGSVTAKAVSIGDIEAAGSGHVLVDGLHSVFTVNGNFMVGNGGNATLTLSGGALLDTHTVSNATLGSGANSTGVVLITGTNSTWTNHGDLYVGRQGLGNLDVEDGGTLSVVAGNIILGADALAVSNLTICDNSTLNIGGTNALQTQGGHYTFTLEGGTIKVQTMDLTTALNVTLVATTVSTIHTNALNATFSGVLSGGGDLTKADAGTLTVSAANTYTGNTTVAGGKLQVNGVMASSSFAILAGGNLAVGANNLLPAAARVTVAAGGNLALSSFNQTLGNVTNNGLISGTGLLTIGNSFVLAGNGAIAANLSLAPGAHVAPGNSIGTLSAGNLTWGGSTDSSATAFFQLSNGDSTSDKIVLTGDLFKGAGTTFKFDFGNTGFGTDGAPNVYTLLSFAGTTDFTAGDFSYLNLNGIGTFDLQAHNLYFTVVPEPAIWGLLLGAAGLAVAVRRKRT